MTFNYTPSARSSTTIECVVDMRAVRAWAKVLHRLMNNEPALRLSTLSMYPEWDVSPDAEQIHQRICYIDRVRNEVARRFGYSGRMLEHMTARVEDEFFERWRAACKKRERGVVNAESP